MLKTVEGIITRTVKYGESSMILDILSGEDGIKSYIVGGIRSKGKKNRSALVSVLNLVKIEAYVKSDDKLSRIKEISFSHVYRSIPFDVVKSSIAMLLVEICRKAAKRSDDSRNVYNYIVKGLIHLDNTDEGLAHFHIKFLIGLAKHLGFEMTNNYSEQHHLFDLKEGSFSTTKGEHRLSLDAEHSRYIHQYLSMGSLDGITRSGRKVILTTLIDYYRYHIDEFGELKSLDVILSLYD